MIDRDKLLEMRRNADEIARDLEARERLAFDDPIAGHDDLMAALSPPIRKSAMPVLVHKSRDNARVMPRQLDAGDDLPPPFTDEQMDIIAEVIAQTRADCQDMIDDALAPLRQQLAVLQGQLDVLMTLLSGNGNRSVEASETVRKLRVG
jgi:hypothetical protein